MGAGGACSVISAHYFSYEKPRLRSRRAPRLCRHVGARGLVEVSTPNPVPETTSLFALVWRARVIRHGRTPGRVFFCLGDMCTCFTKNAVGGFVSLI